MLFSSSNIFLFTKKNNVEALATCRALEFGSELGIRREIMEGDSEVVVKALGNLDNGFHSHGLLINDAALFSGLVSKSLYSHARRDGNKVAYSLAWLAMTTSECTVWMEVVPPRTLPFIQANLVDLS